MPGDSPCENATAGAMLHARRSRKRYYYLVAITMTVLPIVVMTILMMAALAILMIAVVAMISSLCVLVNDKAYLR